MTELAPDVRAVLEQMNASMPAPTEFSVETFRSMVEGHPSEPSAISLAKVEDFTILGPESRLSLRLYRPNFDDDQPCIMFINGGGFIQRDLNSHDELCRRLAKDLDAVVIALSCRPAPEHPYPAAVDDAYAAIVHITNESEALGIDTSKMILAGISSGACVTAATALRCRDANGPRIALQVLLTPMLRHRTPTPSRQKYGNGEHGITTALLDWYSDQYAPGDTAENPYCSPLLANDFRDLAPAYIGTAELDPLKDDGIDYAQRLKDAGVSVVHRDASGLFHGFHFFTDTLPQAQREVSAELDAIRHQLRQR